MGVDLLISELTNAIGLEKVTILLTLTVQHLNYYAHELFNGIRQEISEPRRHTLSLLSVVLLAVVHPSVSLTHISRDAVYPYLMAGF